MGIDGRVRRAGPDDGADQRVHATYRVSGGGDDSEGEAVAVEFLPDGYTP